MTLPIDNEWRWTIPEPEQWNGDDTRPMPSVENHDAHERDANWLLADMIEFRKAYGLRALVRLLAEATI